MNSTTRRVDNKGRKLPQGIMQRRDGVYHARFSYKGRRYSLYDGDLVSLKKKVALAQIELEEGIYGVSNEMTLNSWFEHWMENYKKDKLKPITYQNYKNYWKWYVSPKIGGMQIGELKRIQVISFYNSLKKRKNPLSYGTICYVNNILNSSLEEAVLNDLIKRNPTDQVMKEIVRTEGKARNAISREQEELFFNYIEGNVFFERYRPMFIIAFRTGLRVGELTALNWEDVDFENKMINVDKTLSRYRDITPEGHHYLITTPKTKASIRSIPMTEEVIDAFLQQKEYQERMALRNNIVVNGYKNFVFHTQNGKPYYSDLVNIEIRRIVKVYNKEEETRAQEENREPNLLERFSPHIMRHTFASRCYEVGMDPKVLQKIMGHTKIDTTLDIYTHCSEDSIRHEMEKFSEINMEKRKEKC